MTSGSPAPVVVIAGPTASGKSRLALDVAERFNGTVINADAMQLYRGLPVLTAAPSAAARARVPHRLYEVVDPAEPCSAGRWRAMAVTAIGEAVGGGRLPIVTGGTGLYLRTLMAGIARVPPVPAAIRAEIRDGLAREGAPALYAELARCDPEGAARLQPGDGQRVARALEVLRATGRPLSDWLREPAEGGKRSDYRFLVFLLLPTRAELYARIDIRFAEMVAAGALEEVRALTRRGLDPTLPALKALGVPELSRHLRGEISLDEAVRLGQQATRRYAKRQFTWFRHQLRADRVIEAQYSESYKEETFSQISNFLLTSAG